MKNLLVIFLGFIILISPQKSTGDTLYLKNGQTKECKRIHVVGDKFVCDATDFESYFNKNEVDIEKTNQALSAQKEKLLQEQKDRQLKEKQKKSMERLNAKFLKEQKKKDFEKKYNEKYLVGAWRYFNNGVNSTITIHYEKLQYHLIQKFDDGSKRHLRMQKKQEGIYDKYIQLGANPYGEYYLDDLGRILQVYDYQGLIGPAIRIN